MYYSDYGEIKLYIHKGLSKDQKETMIKLAIENQLFTKNRMHYIDILDQCLALSRMFDDGVPIKNCINNYIYSYTFNLMYF